MSIVGDNILALRKQLGWTQEELAQKMGYKSKSTINKIELGINDIPQSKVVQFAKVLGTTPDKLMGWSPALTEHEQAMLELFKLIPEDKQQLVLQMIKAALSGM